jgi:mono/diheme cytochrome c family protein
MSETKPSDLRNRIGGGLLAIVFGLLVLAIVVAMRSAESSRADPDDSQQVAIGTSVYERACASCHGVKLDGRPNWQSRLPNGRMPAPPHNASGHT